MKQRKILPGDRFGKWVIIAQAPSDKKWTGRRFWCQCDCGNSPKIVRLASLTHKTKPSHSCGCIINTTFPRHLVGVVENISDYRVCTQCGETKNASDFNFTNSKIGRRRGDCKLCEYAKAKEPARAERKSQTNKEWQERNPDKMKTALIRRNKKILSDPILKLRLYVSNAIRDGLNGRKKGGKSAWKHLPYTLNDLKEHLTKLFEAWMTWGNRGIYNPKTWDDNDTSTWTWQMDHITPQSDLPYFSMEDDNFKRCWALENLRPLSAKQNQIDGVSGKRNFT